MLQANVVASAINIAKFKQVAAYDRFDRSSSRINLANNVRLAVGHVKFAAVRGDAGGLRESGFKQQAIQSCFASGTCKRGNFLRVEIEFPNLMRASHRDVQLPSD